MQDILGGDIPKEIVSCPQMQCRVCVCVCVCVHVYVSEKTEQCGVQTVEF